MLDTKPDHQHLVELAYKLGANNTAILSSIRIKVRDQLALKCSQPRCANYGKSFSCQPYVSGPAGFRELVKQLPDALPVQLVVPATMLLSWERFELGRIHHELVARLEQVASELSLQDSRAFAGGCCKELFCQ